MYFGHHFVSHRLGEIDELSIPSEWKWILCKENPADDSTRDLNSPLNKNERWFHGPLFLRENESAWPSGTFIPTKGDLDSANSTKKKVFVGTITESTFDTTLVDFSRFSSWLKLLYSLAWVFVAIDRMLRKKEPKVSLEHLITAEKLLIKTIQRQSFPEEVRAVSNHVPIPKNSRLIPLMPAIDTDGILRVQGRVKDKVDASFDNCPIILDRRNPATRLLLKYYHEEAKHGSNILVMNEIRQKYWIVNLRNSLRTTVTKCILCRTRRAKPVVPVMGELPSARVAYRQPPFSHTGLDYFGPMLVQIGRRREKRWGALFTCLTTRAIHIELTNSLSSDSAIMALRRMSARRGQPVAIYSDNGTNFRGADNELTEALRNLDFEAQRSFALKIKFNGTLFPRLLPTWEARGKD